MVNDGSFATCPRCEGRGPFTAFVTRSDGHCTVEEMPCSFCAGTGDVTHEKARAYLRGLALMEVRRSEGRSLFEVAKGLGISPAELSGIEHGRREGDYERITQFIKDMV